MCVLPFQSNWGIFYHVYNYFSYVATSCVFSYQSRLKYFLFIHLFIVIFIFYLYEFYILLLSCDNNFYINFLFHRTFIFWLLMLLIFPAFWFTAKAQMNSNFPPSSFINFSDLCKRENGKFTFSIHSLLFTLRTMKYVFLYLGAIMENSFFFFP